MAINDFTGQNIKDTYQRVVQTDGTNVTDGTGSLLPISFDGNNVVISGSLSATEYIVTSSVTNVIFQQQSGSTIFGDSADDVHQFTGSVSMSKNLHVVGDISASNVKVDATTLTIGNQPLNQSDLANLKVGKSIISDDSTLTINTTDSEDNVSNSANYIRPQMWIHNSDVESALIHNTAHSLHFRTAGGDPFRIHTDNNTNNFVRLGTFAGSNIILRGNVTASSNISASGTITSNDALIVERLYFGGLGGGNIHFLKDGNNLALANGDFSVSEITASSNISASGDIHAGDFYIKQGGKIYNERFTGTNIQLNQGQILFHRGTGASQNEIFRIGSTGFVINEGSNSSTQADFRVESNTDQYNIFSDASADKVGIGTSTLTEKLTVGGNIQATGFITASILSASTEIHTPILKGTGITTGFHVDGFISSSHITSSGNISASGNLLINQITASGDIKLTEDARINFDNETSGDQYITGRDDYLTVDGDEILHLRADNYVNLDSDSTRATHITASGNISASGYVSASVGVFGQLIGEGLTLNANTGIFGTGTTTINDDINTTGNITASGDISSSNIVQGLSGSFQVISGLGPGGGGDDLDIIASDDIRMIPADNLEIRPGNALKSTFFAEGGVRINDNSSAAPFNELHVDGTTQILGEVTASGDISASGIVTVQDLIIDYGALPSSDPSVAGQVYRNGSNQLFVSAG